MERGVEHKLSLVTMMKGAAVERFDDELDMVLRNVVDFNADHRVSRSVILQLDLKPNEERTHMSMTMSVKSKIAPPKKSDGHAYLGQADDGVAAVEYDPSQPVLAGIADHKARKQA